MKKHLQIISAILLLMLIRSVSSGQAPHLAESRDIHVVKVYATGDKPELVATIQTGELPHGIWPSGDGTHIYVTLENGTGMNVINPLTNKVEARISGGQFSQALVYVPKAAPTGEGLDHLEPLAEAGLSAHLVLGVPGTSTREAPTTVTLNNQGLIDSLQAAVTGLKPKATYLLALVKDREHSNRDFQPLTSFKQTQPGPQSLTRWVGCGRLSLNRQGRTTGVTW